jgi:hypothetical protein
MSRNNDKNIKKQNKKIHNLQEKEKSSALVRKLKLKEITKNFTDKFKPESDLNFSSNKDC